MYSCEFCFADHHGKTSGWAQASKWEERLGWRPKWLNGFIFTVGEGCICSSTIVIAWCFHILLKLRSVLCLYLVSLDGWCNKRYYRSLFVWGPLFLGLDCLSLVHEKLWHLSEVTQVIRGSVCSINLACCLSVHKFYWNTDVIRYLHPVYDCFLQGKGRVGRLTTETKWLARPLRHLLIIGSAL